MKQNSPTLNTDYTNTVIVGTEKHVKTTKGGSVILRAQEGGEAQTVVRVPISSLTMDRDGDHFSERGIASMLSQLKSGKVPFYLDHGRAPGEYSATYSVLDMQGKWVDGEVDGQTLYGIAELDGGDPRSVELQRKLQAGLPIGFSVGFIVREAEPITKDGKETGGLMFHDVDLLEVSAVGIPSNPDGVMNAVAALAKSLGWKETALRERLGLKEATDMETTTEEKAQIEAQSEAGDGLVPALEPKEAEAEPEMVSVDVVRGMIAEAHKGLVADIVAALKEVKEVEVEVEVDDDEDEEEEEAKMDEDHDKEDEEEEKSAYVPRIKAAPRAIITGAPEGKSLDSEETAKSGPVPFQFRA